MHINSHSPSSSPLQKRGKRQPPGKMVQATTATVTETMANPASMMASFCHGVSGR